MRVFTATLRFTGWRQCLGCLGLLMALFASPTVGQSAATVQTDVDIKTAYVARLLRHVRWPGSRHPASDQPIEVCVYGRTPLAEAVMTLDGQKIHAHAISMRRIIRPVRLSACHVFVQGGSGLDGNETLYEHLAALPVLTIGEARGFASRFGILGFVLENSTVRLEVNHSRARAAGVQLSSDLLSVARRVSMPEVAP